MDTEFNDIVGRNYLGILLMLFYSKAYHHLVISKAVDENIKNAWDIMKTKCFTIVGVCVMESD